MMLETLDKRIKKTEAAGFTIILGALTLIHMKKQLLPKMLKLAKPLNYHMIN